MGLSSLHYLQGVKKASGFAQGLFPFRQGTAWRSNLMARGTARRKRPTRELAEELNAKAQGS